MKKICSLILALVMVLSCMSVSAAEWSTEPLPDLKIMTPANIIYKYIQDDMKDRSVDSSDIDEITQKKFFDMVVNHKYIVVDEQLPDDKMNNMKDAPSTMEIVAIFDYDSDYWNIFFFDTYAIMRKQIVTDKLFYCEYSDANFYNSLKELLKPAADEHLKKQEEKEAEIEANKKPPRIVENFTRVYSATFLEARGEAKKEIEWGLCTYSVNDIKYSGAYISMDKSAYIVRKTGVQGNYISWQTYNMLFDGEEITEKTTQGKPFAEIELTIDDNYNVVALKHQYQTYQKFYDIDMSTYKAQGSLKDFPGFEFVPNAPKEEIKDEVKEQPEEELKEELPEKEESVEDNKEEEQPAEEEKKEEVKEEIKEPEKQENTETEEKPKEENISVWAREEVQKAKDLGIAEEDKVYEYTNPITREEFCELMYNYAAMVNKLPESNAESFADTDNVKIGALYNMGIINGKSETVFDPDAYLTREEAAAILHRTVNKTAPSTAITEMYFAFADEGDISDWASASIQAVCNMGVMKGMGEDRFAPKGIYTTEQAIATIIRMYEVIK